MKHLTLALCASSILFFSCNNSGEKTDAAKTDSLKTTEQTVAKDDALAAMPDSATIMKNWQGYMTPGDMHAMLAKSSGTWISDVTVWQAPGAPPSTSKGTLVNKMVMGGRYLEGTNSGNMMGMPFEGRSLTAYDNAKKVFVNSWIDNFGTGIMIMEGTWDEAGKSINFTGKAIDPMTLKETSYRQICKMADDNTQVMEMFGPSPVDGKEMKTMEIKFTRKK